MKKIKGQISIFLILVFMVLFTMFGMMVSVGMFIHDKINVQNSADLAAYYVAAKQAEILGAIAHSNYQIRQSWKLMAFRYRVFANASRTLNSTDGSIRHPGIQNNYAIYLNSHNIYRPAALVNSKPPRICLFASHLFKDVPSDNACKKINFNVEYLPPTESITLGGVVGGVNTTVQNVNLNIQNKAFSGSYVNWWFANTILAAHRLEQRDRRAVIKALVENLAKPIVPGPDGMVDIEGQSIYEGACNTFQYNLTESNKAGLVGCEGYDFVVTNPVEGNTDWLQPIYVNPILARSNFSTATGITEVIRTHFDFFIPQGEAVTVRNRLDPENLAGIYGGAGMGIPDELYSLTVGYEKNPWIFIYNKINVNLQASPLFLVGNSIPVQATSYAKPFGGRIGPWFYERWPQSSETSSGGNRTDPLLPDRLKNISEFARMPLAGKDSQYPNYSKFPGDDKGLTTFSAAVAAGRVIGWPLNAPASQVDARLSDYSNVTYSYFNSGLVNDPLATNSTPGADREDSFYRRLEIAAINPDAFDITYYSISPIFYSYYVKKLEKWIEPQLPDFVELRGDIGAIEGHEDYNIIDQFKVYELSNKKFDNAGRTRNAAWLNLGGGSESAMWKGLLNAWMPGQKPMDYPEATDGELKAKFMNCSTALINDSGGLVVDENRLIPNGCLSGGRVGYSVKLISGDYLRSSKHSFGGSTGAIKNPL